MDAAVKAKVEIPTLNPKTISSADSRWRIAL
jgi:hypothetical protein